MTHAQTCRQADWTEMQKAPWNSHCRPHGKLCLDCGLDLGAWGGCWWGAQVLGISGGSEAMFHNHVGGSPFINNLNGCVPQTGNLSIPTPLTPDGVTRSILQWRTDDMVRLLYYTVFGL